MEKKYLSTLMEAPYHLYDFVRVSKCALRLWAHQWGTKVWLRDSIQLNFFNCYCSFLECNKYQCCTGRQFQTLAEHCLAYSRSINLMIMLGFFTSTAMQRFFSIQTTIPGIAKSITVFASSLKPNLPEVSRVFLFIDNGFAYVVWMVLPVDWQLLLTIINCLVIRVQRSWISLPGGSYYLGYFAFVLFADLYDWHFQIWCLLKEQVLSIYRNKLFQILWYILKYYYNTCLTCLASLMQD